MAATQLGTITQTAPGATTEYSADGITHTVIKTMPKEIAETRSNHPSFGSTLNVQDAVVRLASFSITYEPGELAVVTYRYVGNDGGNTADPNNGQSGMPVGAQESYELDVSLEQQSILRWAVVKYPNISIADLGVLRVMVQNGLKDSNGADVRNQLSAQAAGSGAEIVADLIQEGVTSFLAPVYVWRRRRSSASWQPADTIGKISTPVGPYPNTQGINWLYMGATASGAGQTADQLTDTWQSSPSGDTWNRYIYGDLR